MDLLVIAERWRKGGERFVMEEGGVDMKGKEGRPSKRQIWGQRRKRQKNISSLCVAASLVIYRTAIKPGGLWLTVVLLLNHDKVLFSDCVKLNAETPDTVLCWSFFVAMKAFELCSPDLHTHCLYMHSQAFLTVLDSFSCQLNPKRAQSMFSSNGGGVFRVSWKVSRRSVFFFLFYFIFLLELDKWSVL